MGLHGMLASGTLVPAHPSSTVLALLASRVEDSVSSLELDRPARRRFLAACEACLRVADLALAEAGYDVAETVDHHERALARTVGFTLPVNAIDRADLERLIGLAAWVVDDGASSLPGRDVERAVDLAHRLWRALPEEARPQGPLIPTTTRIPAPRWTHQAVAERP